jgi:hypothetical protein
LKLTIAPTAEAFGWTEANWTSYLKNPNPKTLAMLRVEERLRMHSAQLTLRRITKTIRVTSAIVRSPG